MRAIIPCAGLGTRMKMKHNESKEMLHDPTFAGLVIDYSLDLCQEFNLNPLVVTRKEKTDLIQYCAIKNIETMIIEPEGEWTNTVYISNDYWEKHNILILPDTRFQSPSVIEYMKRDLENGAKCSVALHKVTDPERWCIVNDYILYEKPDFDLTYAYAMGLIAFDNIEGQYIFPALEKDKTAVPKNMSFQYLDSFKDITRSGIIERY